MLKVTYLSIDQVPITSLTLFNLDLEQEPPIPQNEAPGRRRHLDGGQQWAANRRVVHHHHHCHPPLPLLVKSASTVICGHPMIILSIAWNISLPLHHPKLIW